MKTRRLKRIAAIVAILAAPASAQAQTVIGATAATTQSGASLTNVINQSGLSSSYTSGVTGYTSYVAGTTHTAIGNASFGTTQGLQTFTFSFAQPTEIGGIGVFGIDSPGAITSFNLYTDADANFANGTGTLLGSYTLAQNVTSAQSFTFSPVTTSFIQFQITGTRQANTFPGLGEVIFQSAVPEPASWAIMIAGFAIAGAALRRRRRRASAIA